MGAAPTDIRLAHKSRFEVAVREEIEQINFGKEALWPQIRCKDNEFI